MKALIMSLLISMGIMISGCQSQPVLPAHPALDIPHEPDLPHFTREMVDCGNAKNLELCKRIKLRELVLQDYIDTLVILIIEHNKLLRE
jgi:hypothetical protein